MTVAEVRAALGTEADGNPHSGARTLGWPAGWTNDGIGPGDEQQLQVLFAADGRAVDSWLLYDEYAAD